MPEASDLEKQFLVWLKKRSEKIVWKYLRRLEDSDSGHYLEGDYCTNCVILQADTEIVRKNRSLVVDGWDESHESDSASSCDRCGCLLHHSLTRYGVEEELANLAEARELSPYDAAILHNLLDGIGDYRREEDWTSIEPHAIRLMGSSGEQARV